MSPIGNKNRVSDLRRNYGIESRPDIDVAFYYDLFHMGLKAVSSMKEAGTWPELQYEKCNDNTEPITRNLNLLQAIKSVSKYNSPKDFKKSYSRPRNKHSFKINVFWTIFGFTVF